MPAAEVDVDETLVRRLLAEQCPKLAGQLLRLVAFGWDNVVYRLGGELVVRLPRRQIAAVLIEHEQRWLPQLAVHLPLPIPAPVFAGRPGSGYPWKWSVTPWFDGDNALRTPPDDLLDAAVVLGQFCAALHRPASADAPANPVRGGPLATRRPLLESALAAAGATIDGAAVQARWDELEARPPWGGPPVWLHGDLHPGNIVVHDGGVAAVIDFGDITAGDPATDLALGWMLFDGEARAFFRAEAGDVDDDTWARARAWALGIGMACVTNSADNPPFHALGARTVAAALAG
jgi:aminoglycoside phosphotransferase (APT) family kinase protein